MPKYDVTVKQILYYREVIEADTSGDAVDMLIDTVEDGRLEPLDQYAEAGPFKVTEVEPPGDE